MKSSRLFDCRNDRLTAASCQNPIRKPSASSLLKDIKNKKSRKEREKKDATEITFTRRDKRFRTFVKSINHSDKHHHAAGWLSFQFETNFFSPWCGYWISRILAKHNNNPSHRNNFFSLKKTNLRVQEHGSNIHNCIPKKRLPQSWIRRKKSSLRSDDFRRLQQRLSPNHCRHLPVKTKDIF